MQVALASADDYDDLINRIMRRQSVRRLDRTLPIWTIVQEGEWWDDDQLRFHACRRRLLRFLLRNFPDSCLFLRDLEVGAIPGTCRTSTKHSWLLVDHRPIRELEQTYIGDWYIWQGGRPRVPFAIRQSPDARLIDAMREAGSDMYLYAFHDNFEWLLAIDAT